MFAYCGNNPVCCADPKGEAFFVVTGIAGALLGAVIGGLVAASKGKDILSGIAVGAAIGGLAGAGLGAVAGVALAGAATATTASVITGGSALATTVAGGGLAAGCAMIADNFSQSVNYATQVFWSGSENIKYGARQFATSMDGITLDMTRLGKLLEANGGTQKMWEAASANFANIANNAASGIYVVQSSAGVNIDSIWARIEYPLAQLREIIYCVLQ